MTATAYAAPVETIAPEERTLAALTHLSGLAGYVIPLGGVVVPLLIWYLQRESATISGIAKQAVLLNVIVFLTIMVTAISMITVILIPLVLLFWLFLGAVAVVLPIIGTVKASNGEYYRYPLVGLPPRVGLSRNL